jgi:hypothetical protein
MLGEKMRNFTKFYSHKISLTTLSFFEPNTHYSDPVDLVLSCGILHSILYWPILEKTICLLLAFLWSKFGPSSAAGAVASAAAAAAAAASAAASEHPSSGPLLLASADSYIIIEGVDKQNKKLIFVLYSFCGKPLQSPLLGNFIHNCAS